MSVADEIQQYLTTQFLFNFPEDAGYDDDLFEKGLIDSFGMVELVLHLEKKYNLKLTDDDLLSDRVRICSKLIELVEERTVS